MKSGASLTAAPLHVKPFTPFRLSISRRQMKANLACNGLPNRIHAQHFSSSVVLRDGIIPIMGDNAKSIDKAGESLLQPAQISKEDYEELADKTMDTLSATLEEIQEQKGNLDVEYSVFNHSVFCRSQSNRHGLLL